MPWNKPLYRVPKAIALAVSKLETDLLLVAVTKIVPTSAIEAREYNHLWAAPPTIATVSTLPEATVGRFSNQNISGWEIKRTDLPKIAKATRFWQTPNFGDPSRGYTTHVAHQKVYPREYFEAPRAEIETETLKIPSNGGTNYLFRFSVDRILDRKSSTFERDLLFSLNLLRECVGTYGVIKSTATRDDYLKTVKIDWDLFPPGTVEEVVAKYLSRGKEPTAEEKKTVRDRVMLFERLKPEAYISGSGGGFGSYMGAKFADDLVVFENLAYGNAMYVLYDKWEELSKRSRRELIAGADTGFDRIEHRKGWESVFKKLLTKEIAKRK